MFNFKIKEKEAILKVIFSDKESIYYTCECGLESLET